MRLCVYDADKKRYRSTSHSQAKQVIEADVGVHSMLESASLLKKHATVEVHGPSLQLGDFLVRVAIPMQRGGNEVLGGLVVLDVEYMPVSAEHVARPALQVQPQCLCRMQSASASALL